MNTSLAVFSRWFALLNVVAAFQFITPCLGETYAEAVAAVNQQIATDSARLSQLDQERQSLASSIDSNWNELNYVGRLRTAVLDRAAEASARASSLMTDWGRANDSLQQLLNTEAMLQNTIDSGWSTIYDYESNIQDKEDQIIALGTFLIEVWEAYYQDPLPSNDPILYEWEIHAQIYQLEDEISWMQSQIWSLQQDVYSAESELWSVQSSISSQQSYVEYLASAAEEQDAIASENLDAAARYSAEMAEIEDRIAFDSTLLARVYNEIGEVSDQIAANQQWLRDNPDEATWRRNGY